MLQIRRAFTPVLGLDTGLLPILDLHLMTGGRAVPVLAAAPVKFRAFRHLHYLPRV